MKFGERLGALFVLFVHGCGLERYGAGWTDNFLFVKILEGSDPNLGCGVFYY